MNGNRVGESRARGWGEWALLLLAIVCVAAVLEWVDLTPRVESDFFFSRSDPQLRAMQELARRFPSPEQLIVRVEAPDIAASDYRAAIGRLTASLDAVPGVSGTNSVTTEDADRSPLWRRLLLNPDGRSTNLIVRTANPDPRDLTRRVEAVIAHYQLPEFRIVVSGVPYIIELIRRSLLRDLVVFSSAAFVLFGVAVALVYRNRHVVLGTAASCLTASAVTLALTQLLDIKIGLLTANIAVIVFVLTLSHIVFLTSNWKALATGLAPLSGRDPVRAAVSLTAGASFWCMLTTFLGFLSLLIATARPLRELGIAGAIGTLTAISVAYAVYPTFLRAAAVRGPDMAEAGSLARVARLLPRRFGRTWLAGIAAVVLAAGVGMSRLSTDPSLLSYFAPGSELREGLEAIDKDGGSSPLNVAVKDSEGRRLDTDTVNEKMWALQDLLEADSSVGVVVSPALMLGHARLVPFGNMMSWGQLLSVLESPVLGRVGLSFVTADREQGRFFLRMRESGRREPRAAIIDRVRAHVASAGLEADLIGGQYELQGQLGRLIGASLRIGLGGLLFLFIGIAFIVSRSLRRTVAMFACLCAIPAVVLGVLGHLRMPVDIITSPAANVALAMGVDSMIHVVMRVRRLSGTSGGDWEAWLAARDQLWRPVLGAALIICAGFGIFSLSAFPPTQRFGLAVILGTVTAAVMTLVTLPFAAREPRGTRGDRTVEDPRVPLSSSYD